MRIKSKTTIALFCFLLAVSVVSAAKETSDPTLSTAPSPYPVLDSGAWADAIHSPTIFWLDNHRLIFKGTSATQKADAYKKTELQIWDIEKNKITSYAPTTKGIACYTDGTIFYWVQGDRIGEDRYRYGKLGEEKTMELPKKTRTFIDLINCRLVDVDSLTKLQNDRAMRALLDRHGYLDLGPVNKAATSKEFITLHRPGDNQGITVPIQAQWIDNVRYYQFKDAYMIYGIKGGKQFWWLYPNGKVEKVTPSSGFGLPTRQGLVGGWGKIKSNKDPGSMGVYFWSDNESFKLIAGHSKHITISPDGCKLAFVHYPYLDATKIKDPARITLKAINLCTEEKNHGQ